MPEGEFIDFNELLTDNAQASLQKAEAYARSQGSVYVGTEHILLGLLSQKEAIATKMMQDVGVTLDRAQLALNLTPKALVINNGARGLSETAKLTLRMSWDVAREFHQDYCGTEHILYSILAQKNARATVLLKDMQVDVSVLAQNLETFLQRQQSEQDEDYQAGPGTQSRKRAKKGNSILDEFGSDLTTLAKKDELDPVIGRDLQIARMVTILGRRTKNNPVLIGEPGVGKTAIVEGLAQRISRGEAPDNLSEARIISLDLAAMIAGTKYRGEFEERLKRMTQEMADDKNLIVFIDELHLLVGAGAAEGAIDAANMLKPLLARGKARIIGATTLDEYRKHIEKDAALERRFQTITVPEPDTNEAIAIIKGLRHYYEDHHDVKIEDDVIANAVKLAERYIHDRFLPDKAIDVIDETAAHVRVTRGKSSTDIKRLQKEVRLIVGRMEDAVENEDYERAALYKTRLSRTEQKLQDLQKKQRSAQKLVMTHEDVAETIARSTGVPVKQLVKEERTFYRELESHLTKHIIGQDDAVQAVARAIRRSRTGIGAETRPIGSFIFLGPTGVGKTELARVLAREVFGKKDALIKIDMSEFGEKHTSARLVGAPAGYVGYDEGGQLTEKVRRQPYSVILFDEIEKAHPDVLNMLLQILEDGYLTDAKNRRINFTNTIVILTSNIGASKMQKEADFGFSVQTKQDENDLDAMHIRHERDVRHELKSMLRPELINRFDKVVVFRALTTTEAKDILQLQIDELRKRLQRVHLGLKVMPAAAKKLIEEGYDAKNGARPLRRIIQDRVEDGIAEGLLDGKFDKGDVVRVGLKNGSFLLTSERE